MGRCKTAGQIGGLEDHLVQVVDFRAKKPTSYTESTGVYQAKGVNTPMAFRLHLLKMGVG
jgi:hypothetical protein